MATINTYLGNNGNWTDGTNWSLGTAPTTGEVIVIPKVGTAITLDTNLDASLKDFAAVIVQRGSNVTIGASGNPLKCACSGATAPGKIVHEGAKPFYLQAAHATLDIKLLEVNSDNQTLALQIDDDATAQCLHLRVLKGKVETTAGITALPYIEVGRRDNPSSDANLLIDTHASNVVTRLMQNAGTVTIKREITDAIIQGGIFIIDGAEVVTNLYVMGGTVQLDSTGLVTLAMVGAGVLDTTKTWKGKAIDTLRAWRPGHVLLHHGVDVSNDETQPGTVTYDTAGGPSGFGGGAA